MLATHRQTATVSPRGGIDPSKLVVQHLGAAESPMQLIHAVNINHSWLLLGCADTYRQFVRLCGDRDDADVIISQLSHAKEMKAIEIDCYWSERVNVKIYKLVWHSTFIDALDSLIIIVINHK